MLGFVCFCSAFGDLIFCCLHMSAFISRAALCTVQIKSPFVNFLSRLSLSPDLRTHVSSLQLIRPDVSCKPKYSCAVCCPVPPSPTFWTARSLRSVTQRVHLLSLHRDVRDVRFGLPPLEEILEFVRCIGRLQMCCTRRCRPSGLCLDELTPSKQHSRGRGAGGGKVAVGGLVRIRQTSWCMRVAHHHECYFATQYKTKDNGNARTRASWGFRHFNHVRTCCSLFRSRKGTGKNRLYRHTTVPFCTCCVDT